MARVDAQGCSCAEITRTGRQRCGGIALVAMLLANAPAIAERQPLEPANADDPRVAPLVPILQQCVERRALYPSAKAFFRTEYGAVCAAVMLTFGFTTEAELANSWQPW
jgi:hypothetical protein